MRLGGGRCGQSGWRDGGTRKRVDEGPDKQTNQTGCSSPGGQQTKSISLPGPTLPHKSRDPCGNQTVVGNRRCVPEQLQPKSRRCVMSHLIGHCSLHEYSMLECLRRSISTTCLVSGRMTVAGRLGKTAGLRKTSPGHRDLGGPIHCNRRPRT